MEGVPGERGVLNGSGRRAGHNDGMGRRRPQVVAHRGSSADKAEHTLGAYVTALEQGADALECDVRLTADGHLVCVHDRDLRRTAQQRRLISSMELAELEQLDVASWKNPWAELDDEAPDVDLALNTVLTLRRLLETVADYGRPVELAIETKHPTRYAGLVERRLVEVLDSFGWAAGDSPIRVMSFSWVALRRIRRLAPDLDLVYLMDSPLAWASSRPFAEPNWIAGPGIELLHKHPELIRRIRKAGTDVHVWTVNTRADLDLCLEQGVSAVITDRPATMLGYLGS
jgi:glycerophosphoryl diester phosphodiesterase